MSIRLDFVHDVQDSATERRLQQEALSQLRARKAAQAQMDREAAARDLQEKWAAQQVAASKPQPQQGLQQLAQARMVRATSPGWQPPAPATPQASSTFQPGGFAGAARAAMLRGRR